MSFKTNAAIEPAAFWCSFRLDIQGRLVEAAATVEKITGFSAAHWQEQTELICSALLESSQPLYRAHLHQAVLNPDGSLVTVDLRHPSGRTVRLQEFRKGSSTALGKLQWIDGLWIDVSRTCALEQKYEVASWKETLGTLVPGLIHEFNNTLTGILSLTDLFLGQVDATHPFLNGLKLIKQNIHQSSHRLQRLHSLYRSLPGSRCYQDLNELARETVELLQRAIRRAEISLTTAPETLPVYADPVQLQQTLIQLILNALETMPEGGQVRIETKRHQNLPLVFEGKSLRLPVVSVSVEDSGPGLSPSELRTIFDGFGLSGNNGSEAALALQHARQCAENHQGALTATSRPGFGSTFTVWLPEADFSEAENQPTT